MHQEPPKIRYAKAGSAATIAYQVFGEGPTTILVVPGLLNHIETMWSVPEFVRYCRRLSSFSQIVLLDKRGTGLSDRLPPGQRAGLEHRMEDVATVMDAIGVEKGVILGTADGGAVAAMFAATYPRRTAALILYATSARLLAAADYPIGLPNIPIDEFAKSIESRWGNESEPLWGERLAPSLRHDPRWLKVVARMERLAASPSAAVSLVATARETDVRSILKTITVPTLVLHSAGDSLYPAQHGRYIAEQIAGARFVELPGADHIIFHEMADLASDAIQEFLTGSRQAPDPDRVLTTVLFTDIVSSTEKAIAAGDRKWSQTLNKYRDAVRAAIALHRGHEIDTAGDGFLITFDGPGRAVRCAAAIREAARSLELEIRAGIHTGEVEKRIDGITGIAVHIGARVISLAAPGEILVSRTVKDLIAGSGIVLIDRGTHKLKGVPDAWQLFSADI
jgi:pimeloyl-ACP methyl ester carboxylesterase